MDLWALGPWRPGALPSSIRRAGRRAAGPQGRELAYASRQLSAIEVNGTYYSLQKPAIFAKWRDETPDDFVFSLKASCFATNRRVRAEAGESIKRFVGSGIAELAHKPGPVVWQFAPTKRFEPADCEAFVQQLPHPVGGIALRRRPGA